MKNVFIDHVNKTVFIRINASNKETAQGIDNANGLEYKIEYLLGSEDI